MNAPDDLFLPDVQSGVDRRDLAIQQVGVKSLTHPVVVATTRGPCPSVASIDMYVGLPAEQKGTHMSRFVAWLDDLGEPLDGAGIAGAARRMLALLNADAGRVEASFPFFLRKRAPVSGVAGLLEYQGSLVVETRDDAAATTSVTAGVVVPVKSLCPCSKEISDYGAHNQRSHITIEAELLGEISWRELVRFAEVAERTDYAASGGGFNNALSRLRTLDLIGGSGDLRVADTLGEARG